MFKLTGSFRQPALSCPALLPLPSADGLAYSALLKNELLGAGIEKVQDPQSEDRRLQPSTPAKRSLFSVIIVTKVCLCYLFSCSSSNWFVFSSIL